MRRRVALGCNKDWHINWAQRTKSVDVQHFSQSALVLCGFTHDQYTQRADVACGRFSWRGATTHHIVVDADDDALRRVRGKRADGGRV
jgi:hypothetical protein